MFKLLVSDPLTKREKSLLQNKLITTVTVHTTEEYKLTTNEITAVLDDEL